MVHDARQELVGVRKHRLAALPPDEVALRSLGACRLLCAQAEYRDADVIMIFLSMAREVDTAPLALAAFGPLAAGDSIADLPGAGIIAFLVVGVVISLLQALTQIQEMTLVFVPKILAMFVALLLALPFMADALNGHMIRIAARIIGG